MHSIKLLTLEALLALVFIACNGHSKQNVALETINKNAGAVNNKSIEAADTIAQRDEEKIADNEREKKSPAQKNQPPDKIDWDKKIIKTANLDIEVKNYKGFNEKLHETIKKYGGYVSQEEQNESAYKIENAVVLKVPVDQFENAMNAFVSSDEKLISKKITSEDVTTEVVDTKSRMEAKKQARLRYLDFLKQAKNMDEVLQVQTEIDGIQEQLESAAGRIAYLNHASAYSTINLDFYQVLDVNAVTEPDPTFIHKLKEAFNNGWRSFAELLVGLVSLWPLMIVGVLAVILYKRRKRNNVKVA